MTKRIFIANLVKRYNIYTNLQLNKVVNQFNRSQKNLHIDLAHYEVDRFLQHFKHNQLHLGYVTHPGHTKYYDHAEDGLRRAELINLASLQRRHAASDHDTEQSEIEYFTPQRIDLMLTRFGPLFNHNGISVCRAAQQLGICVTNAAQGIANCRDKWQAYRMVADLVPLVNSSFANWETLKNLPKNALNYPRITKPHAYSLGGRNVQLAHNQLQLVQQAYHLDEYDFTLNQDFIPTNPNSSYDLRILCINGEIAGSYIRISAQESIVANIAQGGVGIPYTIDPILAHQALAIVERLGLDICGLDFIYNTKTSQWQFLEANACPGYQGFDEVLGRNFAQEILNYCIIRTTGRNLAYFQTQELSPEQLEQLHPVNREQAQQLQTQWRKEQQFVQLQAPLEQAITELLANEPRTFLKHLETQLLCNATELSSVPASYKPAILRELDPNEITSSTQLLQCISELCLYFQEQLGGYQQLLEQLNAQVAHLTQEELVQALRPQQVMLGTPITSTSSSATSETDYGKTREAEDREFTLCKHQEMPHSIQGNSTFHSLTLASTPSNTSSTSSPTILAGAIGISKVGLLPNLPYEANPQLNANSTSATTIETSTTANANLEVKTQIETDCACTPPTSASYKTSESDQPYLSCEQLQELHRAWCQYCWNPLSNAPRHPSNNFPMLPSPIDVVQPAEAQLRATPKKKFKD